MSTINVLMGLVVLLLIIVGTYFLYKNNQEINKKIVTVEKTGEFTATEGDQGIGDFATCPSGSQILSGGCSSASAPATFILHAQEPIKSNGNLDYNNAWQCSFSATEAGTFIYKVVANCK